VLTNLLGTEQRICRALGVSGLSEAASRLSDLTEPSEPGGWFDRLKASPPRGVLGKLPPKSVKTGVCQQVIRLGGDVDLSELPVLRSHPEEQGPVVTAAQVFARGTDSGRRAVERHELRVLDDKRIAVSWAGHDELAQLAEEYRQRNQRMPLAVVLGGDPARLLAAVAPLPSQADVCAVAGLLRNKAVDLVRCRTIDLEVPADAEMVIEGFVDPAEPAADPGPMASWGGHCRVAGEAPVMQVTAVSHRSNPIYPAMVPGGPPDEVSVVRRALMLVFLPLVRAAIPDLIDCDFPEFGAARHWALVSIRKTHAGQARRVAHAVWGLRQTMFAKLLVVVDDDVNVHDPRQAWSAVAANMEPGRHVFFSEGPVDPWDPASVPGVLNCRMALDATRKLPGESGGHPRVSVPDADRIVRVVTERWSEYGLAPDDRAE
jgi:4-hydroxy-3-polyprenylbenzoate decarboxylase